MNTLLRNEIPIIARQRGAVLVVSMLLLLVMTVLALSMSQTARLDERMAGNSRDHELAFQSAESALRAAEDNAMNINEQAVGCDYEGTIGSPTDPIACPAMSLGAAARAGVDLRDASPTWWSNNSLPYGDSDEQEMPGLYNDPNIVVEEAGSASIGGLDVGLNTSNNDVRKFYRITVHSFGKGQGTRVINESVVSATPP